MFQRSLAVIALVAMVLSAPAAKAAGKTICLVTFSLQIGYLQL